MNTPNNQAYITNETPENENNHHNNDLSSTFILSTRQSMTNLPSLITSVDSQNSSLFSEIRNLTGLDQPSNSKFVDQTVTVNEPSNHFQHDQLSLIDDTLNQLRNIIDSSSSSVNQSSNSL